jgi:hypothetical protein
MKKTIAVATLALLAGWCAAADSLSLREVEASNDGSGVPAALQDVGKVLQSSVGFTGYRLLSSRTLPLPASGSVALQNGYTFKCSGPRENLEVLVTRGTEEILRTTASLRPGKPLVLGGFPGARGRVLLVLVVKRGDA